MVDGDSTFQKQHWRCHICQRLEWGWADMRRPEGRDGYRLGTCQKCAKGKKPKSNPGQQDLFGGMQ